MDSLGFSKYKIMLLVNRDSSIDMSRELLECWDRGDSMVVDMKPRIAIGIFPTIK